MDHKEISKNIKAVLDILKNEVDGDVKSALEKMTGDYSMTWMYKRGNELFPTTGRDISKEMDEVYPIKGRKYDIRNIAEGDDVVIVELIESYPDPDTSKEYCTPIVLVLEMQEGKIKKGRHYCDPQLSFLNLSAEQIDYGLKGTGSKVVID